MSEVLAALDAPIDAGLGGVLLANMVEAWLVGNPDEVTGAEVANELQDHGATPEQTGLHLCPPVDECSGAPPPGKHGTPVCIGNDGAGARLERVGDSGARSGPWPAGDRADQAGGFQDSGGGCLDGPSVPGVCAGGFTAGALQSRLALAAGGVCAER